MNRNWRQQLQCDSLVTGIVYFISQQASQREVRDKIEWKIEGWGKSLAQVGWGRERKSTEEWTCLYTISASKGCCICNQKWEKFAWGRGERYVWRWGCIYKENVYLWVLRPRVKDCCLLIVYHMREGIKWMLNGQACVDRKVFILILATEMKRVSAEVQRCLLGVQLS